MRYEMQGDMVVVTTASGTYRAKSLILSAGAWMGDLVSEMGLPLVVQRHVQFWFRPSRAPELFLPSHFPISFRSSHRAGRGMDFPMSVTDSNSRCIITARTCIRTASIVPWARTKRMRFAT